MPQICRNMNILRTYLLFGDFSYIQEPDRRLLDFRVGSGTVFNYGYVAWMMVSCLLLMDQATDMTIYSALPDIAQWLIIALYAATAIFSAIYTARIRSNYTYIFLLFGAATPMMIYRLIGYIGG